ncbi:MAG: hypothetical protein Q9M26_04010 [Mariprofundales bacterium]|nr:hypothetical protein [Mariprofundales bacterium]
MYNFEKLVEKCRKDEKYFVIHNASRAHARILFQNLLIESAEKHEDVCLLSGKLDAKFYDDLLPDVTKALQAGVKVRVLIAENDSKAPPSQRFIDAVCQFENGTVRTNTDLSSNIPHFIVVGDHKYRLELDDDASRAVANFRDEMVGQRLVSGFNDVWGRSPSHANAK